MADIELADRWVLDPHSDPPRQEIRNLDGVWWHEAPKPFRWHRCEPQTIGWMNYFTKVERCACGAIAIDGGRWADRNSR